MKYYYNLIEILNSTFLIPIKIHITEDDKEPETLDQRSILNDALRMVAI